MHGDLLCFVAQDMNLVWMNTESLISDLVSGSKEILACCNLTMALMTKAG